jgi:hypothetical protein
MCGCDQGEWIDDGRGGYYDNPTGAKPTKEPSGRKRKRRRVIIIEED